MFLKRTDEDNAFHQEKQINELLIENEQLDRHIEDFLHSLNVTPQQLSAFLENPSHFTQQNWDQLSQEKKRLDEQLSLKLNSTKNPLEKRSKPNNPQWLFVR